MNLPRSPYQRTEDLEAALPVGMTCSDCVHFDRCAMLHQSHPQDEICDWLPVRFLRRLELVEDRTLEQRIADGDAPKPVNRTVWCVRPATGGAWLWGATIAELAPVLEDGPGERSRYELEAVEITEEQWRNVSEEFPGW